MIPSKKKSLEEIATLREGLGIPEARPDPAASQAAAAPAIQGNNPWNTEESVVHLDVVASPGAPPRLREPKTHSLRKRELPLAPAPSVANEKTELPMRRHDPEDFAEIRKRAALASLSSPTADPATHLKKITASLALLIPAYLTAFGAALSAWSSSEFFTPLGFVAISSLMAAYIHLAKKRSRHHSAILAVVIIMTVAFGSLRYFPIFSYAP